VSLVLMAREIIWTAGAEADLQRLYEQVDDHDLAMKLLHDPLEHVLRLLADFPGGYEEVPHESALAPGIAPELVFVMKIITAQPKMRTRSDSATGSVEPTFMKTIRKLARPRDWPADYALNHGHYAKGHTSR
jgi:hypothetical protein